MRMGTADPTWPEVFHSGLAWDKQNYSCREDLELWEHLHPESPLWAMLVLCRNPTGWFGGPGALTAV